MTFVVFNADTMKRMIYPLLLMILLTGSAFHLALDNSAWRIVEDSYLVKFSGKRVEGVFRGLKSDIQFDEQQPARSKIIATIETASVQTGNGLRNMHARQALDTDRYPAIIFESHSIRKSGRGYLASGQLTIRNVTRNITIPFTFTRSAEGGIFDGTFSLAPADFQVRRMGTPDTIAITLRVPVSQ